MGKTAPTCVSYVRTSTVGQRDAMTIKAQRTTVERLQGQYGAERLAYGPRRDGRLEDDGRSGRLLAGREFAKFVDDVEAGRVKPDYLIVPSTSRLSREDTFSDDKAVQVQSAIDAARINSILRVHGVKVIDTKGVHLDLRQEALEDSHERDKIRERTMSGKAEKFSDGKRATGGHAPYGYKLEREDRDNRRSGLVQVRDPDNAPRLDQLIAWFIKGGYTHAAGQATKAEFPLPKSRKIGDWNAVTVRHIIKHVRDGVYSGKQSLEFNGTSHTLKYPALVDAQTRAAVVRAMQELTLTRDEVFLSTGFADCRCGAHVFERNTHGHHHAWCRNKCGGVPEPLFTATLWKAAVARLVQIAEHTGTDRAINTFDVRLRAATEKAVDIEARIGRLWDAKEAGDIPVAVWAQRKGPLNDALAMAKADVSRIEGERAEDERKRAGEQSLEARVGALLEDLVRRPPSLDSKQDTERMRKALGELLAGGRVIVDWGRAKAWRPRGPMRSPKSCDSCGQSHSPDVPSCAGCYVCLTGTHCTGCHSDWHDVERCPAFGRWAAITFPAYRELPPVTVRTDRQPWQLAGDAIVRDGKVLLRVRPERRRNSPGEGGPRLLTTPRNVLEGGEVVWERPPAG